MHFSNTEGKENLQNNSSQKNGSVNIMKTDFVKNIRLS